MSTHNLCFEAKNKKNQVYPCIPQFCYIKVGYKGEYITRTCYLDVRKIELGCYRPWNFSPIRQVYPFVCMSEIFLSQY